MKERCIIDLFSQPFHSGLAHGLLSRCEGDTHGRADKKKKEIMTWPEDDDESLSRGVRRAAAGRGRASAWAAADSDIPRRAPGWAVEEGLNVVTSR